MRVEEMKLLQMLWIGGVLCLVACDEDAIHNTSQHDGDQGSFLNAEDDFWDEDNNLPSNPPQQRDIPRADVAPVDMNTADAEADLPDHQEEPTPPIDAHVFTEEFTRPEQEEPFNLDDFVGVSGQTDCLQWDLMIQSTDLTFKSDRIFVVFGVRNICSRDLLLRTLHESDFLPVGIEKDGEPWIFLPDCPGTGPETTYTLAPREGWRRGWFWSPEDHEARLTRCGVTFDENATYQIIGYGLTPAGAGYSSLFQLTDPISIEFR